MKMKLYVVLILVFKLTFTLAQSNAYNQGNVEKNKQNTTMLKNIEVKKDLAGGVVDNKQALLTITASNTIAPSATAIYHTGENILLTSGFFADKESVFYGYIDAKTAVQDENQKEINDVLLTNAFSIFPNPADTMIHLKLNIVSDAALSVSILNTSGQLVQKIAIPTTSQDTITQIDISALASGIYFAKLQTPEKSFVQKIIKN